jgi:transcriptional regulator with XRE-family HTH domain
MKIYRIRKNMTQEELALLIGSYQVRVSRIENHVESPTSDEIQKIEKVLGVQIWSNR